MAIDIPVVNPFLQPQLSFTDRTPLNRQSVNVRLESAGNSKLHPESQSLPAKQNPLGELSLSSKMVTRSQDLVHFGVLEYYAHTQFGSNHGQAGSDAVLVYRFQASLKDLYKRYASNEADYQAFYFVSAGYSVVFNGLDCRLGPATTGLEMELTRQGVEFTRKIDPLLPQKRQFVDDPDSDVESNKSEDLTVPTPIATSNDGGWLEIRTRFALLDFLIQSPYPRSLPHLYCKKPFLHGALEQVVPLRSMVQIVAESGALQQSNQMVLSGVLFPSDAAILASEPCVVVHE